MSESPTPAEPSRRASWLPVLALVAVGGILVAALFRTPWEQDRILPPSFTATAVPSRPESIDFSGYIGEQSCAECHPGEAAAHSGSGHSRTLWPAGEGAFARWLAGQKVRDPEQPAVEWSYQLTGKDLEARRHEGADIQKMSLELGVGSGKHGVTFVTMVPGSAGPLGPAALEHRFSYLSPTGKMEITPGQESADAKKLKLHLVPFGRIHTPEQIIKCLACHSTLTSRVKLQHLDPATMVPNVTCERCHGPGRDHIEAARQGRTDDLKMPMTLLTEPRYQVEQCGECHRLPKDIGRAALYAGNAELSRFQSVGLSMSACFAKGREMKCSTCHEVHGRTSRDTAGYEAACLECHRQGAAHRPCPVNAKEGCIGCHMPKKQVPGGWLFSDHWIRKPGDDPGPPPTVVPPRTTSTTRRGSPSPAEAGRSQRPS
ncbi:MAG: multiheme c-type cytochrome [Isosphaeraceae bacterium]